MTRDFNRYNKMTTEDLNAEIAVYVKDMNEANELSMQALVDGDDFGYTTNIKIANNRLDTIQTIKAVLSWRA